jgi:hypothetical protein
MKLPGCGIFLSPKRVTNPKYKKTLPVQPTGFSRKDDRRQVASPGGPSRTCHLIEAYGVKTLKTI